MHFFEPQTPLECPTHASLGFEDQASNREKNQLVKFNLLDWQLLRLALFVALHHVWGGEGGAGGGEGYLVFIIIKEVVDKVGCFEKIRPSKGEKIENPPTLFSV